MYTRAISSLVLSSIILPLQTFFSQVLLLRQQAFLSGNLSPDRPTTTTTAIQTQVFMFRSCILWGATTDASVDISVDTAIDTRSTIGRYSIEYRSIYRSSVDRCIDRYFTDTSLILHRYFTDTAPMLHRYFSSYIGRHSTETRAVDKCSSIGRCICRYNDRYIGR